MGFMIPVAEHFAAYHVETNEGTEVVPEELCGTTSEECYDQLLEYCEGRRIVGDVERKEGWYGRLSAPGYLDCTSWQGPYETADEALDAVKEQFDVDDNGDPSDGDVADGPSSERGAP
jgi:hypothetical protein